MASYKTLTEDWRNYMDQLNNPYFSKHFTSEMKNNRLFNFSRYIDEDMKTFLISIAGNDAKQLPMKMFCDLIFENYSVNIFILFLELFWRFSARLGLFLLNSSVGPCEVVEGFLEVPP